MLFKLQRNSYAELLEERINYLFDALRMNGQILGREFPIGRNNLIYRAFLHLPEQDSLNVEIGNSYVKSCYDKLKELDLSYSYEIIGEEPTSAPICECNSIDSYILYTTYVSLESPLRCGVCFGTVPLYKISHTCDGEYSDIISWNSDYQACDTLQMNCMTGERFGYQQISEFNSSLSKRGIDICDKVLKLTGKKTYYYLYRSKTISKNKEISRKCPSCGGEWLLNETMHEIFNFCCNKCSLLSNISNR